MFRRSATWDSGARRPPAGRPELLNYKLDDRDIDGTITGISVGAVVELGAPGTEVLSLDPLSAVHLDSITLRSLVSLVGAMAQFMADIGWNRNPNKLL